MNEDDLLFTQDDLRQIESIGADFAHYLQRVRPAFETHVIQQSRSLEHIVSTLENYYFYLSFIGDSKVLNNSHRAVLGIAAKTATDEASIYHLTRLGYPLQARTVLRSLLETAITAKFIYMDFPKRIEWFHDYKDFVRYNKMIESPDTIPVNEHDYLRMRYPQISDRYNKYGDWYYNLVAELRATNPGIPKRPSIRGVAIAADMQDDYESMYDTLSLATHTSPVIDHVFVHGGNFSMTPRFDRPLAKTSISLTIHYAHIIYEQILEHINTEQSKALLQYSKMLMYMALKIHQN